MEKVEWDDLFMSLVYLIAAKSKDKKTHIGAVVVGPDKEIRSVGYNNFVRKINDEVAERQEEPEKFFWFEHAERNAIYNATLIGCSLKCGVLYTNGVPCMDCARAVVQAGIKEVVVDKDWDSKNSEKWKEHTEKTIVMFKEAGVKIRYWGGKFIKLHKFRRGEIAEL